MWISSYLKDKDFRYIDKNQTYYLCKKSYTISNISYNSGEIYKVLEIQYGPCIVFEGGCYFFCGDNFRIDSRPYLFEYFCNKVEERKVKLEKIQENVTTLSVYR